jgi:hypothetical protein
MVMDAAAGDIETRVRIFLFMGQRPGRLLLFFCFKLV